MRWLALLLIVGAAGGCSNSESPPAQAESCESYAAGMSKTSGPLTVTLVESTPGPLIVGSNAMKFTIRDAANAPVEGTVTLVPFMPEHGHGSGQDPVVKADGNGQYSISDVYLPMPGLWRLTVGVDTASAGHQEAAFRFCL